MSRPRTNVCLSMIVKDEVEVLPRVLRSVKDVVDSYVIVDTGSTDGTQELIRREMSGYGIEGEVHEREWVNFGVNRQQALELAVATGKAKWLLFLDASEELGVSDPKFYEKLEPGVSYDLETRQGEMRYVLPRLVNVETERFRWEGVVHEHLVGVEGPGERSRRADVWIVHHPRAGGPTGREKYLRDAELLEADLTANPGNARSQFYLAQSYRDAGQRARAYAEYRKRAEMSGWAEETFMARLEAGRLALALEEPEEVVLREYLDAFNLRPTRVEPLHDLARYFRLKKQYGKAYIFARTGVEIQRPDDQLFLAQEVYDWRMLDELGIAAYWIGDLESAREACETVLARARGSLSIPPDELRRIQRNLAYTLSKAGTGSGGASEAVTTSSAHRMLVVHNIASGGERLSSIEPKAYRKFAFGSLLAYVDEVAKRNGKQRMLQTDSLALPGDEAVYGKAQLQGIPVLEKYDSVMCHLVLDHGGVLDDDFFSILRADFLKTDGILLNPVKSITKNDVARASSFELETEAPPWVIKKNNNYNRPETVLELFTQAELDAWRAKNTTEEQSQFVVHKLLRYFGLDQSGLYQLERWIVLFDDLTVNYRYSDESYIKSATSLSYYVRDERRMSDDVRRLAASGYRWKGRSIDCAYQREPEAWDARYAVLKTFRDAFRLDYAELDVIQPSENEFVVIDVNHTPGPSYKNVYWRELAVQLLGDRLGIRSGPAD